MRNYIEHTKTFYNLVAISVIIRCRYLIGTKLKYQNHQIRISPASSSAAERESTGAKGLMLFSFPLHPSKKPDTKRAAHLADIELPMLFLSGDRDTLAEKELLEGELAKLASADLHWLETADHSFKILKRTRTSTEDVYAEAARVAKCWLERLELLQ